jgi:integrase
MRTPSAYKASDGVTTYKVRYRVRGRQSSATFDTKPEAVKFCTLLDTVGVEQALAYLKPEPQPATAPTSYTLDQWATRYIASLTGITDGTRVGYTRLYNRAWHPALGHLPLPSIDREHIAAQVNALSANRADKTVANAHGLLAAMMATAVLDGLLAMNPCRGIRLPRRTAHEKVEHRYLTHGEFEQLLACIPEHYVPLVMLLIGSGMRWGEAEALTVADVDIARATVSITKAVKWDASKATRPVGPPKTRKSRRTVTLPAQTVDALRPLVEGRHGADRLFLAPRGGNLRHRTFYDSWKRSCERSGIQPHPRVHDVRHSHVAWLVAAGVPLPVIQQRLGHESITTTIDTYGHLLPDLQAAAAHAAGVALEGATRPRLVAV